MSVAALETDDPRALLQRVGKDELKAGTQGAINTGWPTEKALGILTSAVIGCFSSVDNSDAYKAQYRWLEKLEQEAVAPDGPAPTLTSAATALARRSDRFLRAGTAPMASTCP